MYVSKFEKIYLLLLIPVCLWLFGFNFFTTINRDNLKEIDVNSLPNLEKYITGRKFNYNRLAHHEVISFFTSIPYLFHFSIPFVASFLILFGYSQRMFAKCWTCKSIRLCVFLFIFGFLNITSIVIQFSFPTAPTWWYADQIELEELEKLQERENEIQTNSTFVNGADDLMQNSNINREETINVDKEIQAVVWNGEELYVYELMEREDYVFPNATYETKQSESRLRETDQFLGVHIFKYIYAQSSIVFGAFPSLHAAWPVLFSYEFYNQRNFYLFALYCSWIWFSALYLKHHFVVDIIFGTILSLFSIFIGNVIDRNLPHHNNENNEDELEKSYYNFHSNKSEINTCTRCNMENRKNKRQSEIHNIISMNYDNFNVNSKLSD